MIKLVRVAAKDEPRKRDGKRRRYLLSIGKKAYHLTLDEVEALYYRSKHLVWGH